MEKSQLENLDVIEADELKVGNAFHAFRFKSIDDGSGDVDGVADLEVIEAEELKVGNAFHAFRFKSIDDGSDL